MDRRNALFQSRKDAVAAAKKCGAEVLNDGSATATATATATAIAAAAPPPWGGVFSAKAHGQETALPVGPRCGKIPSSRANGDGAVQSARSTLSTPAPSSGVGGGGAGGGLGKQVQGFGIPMLRFVANPYR